MGSLRTLAASKVSPARLGLLSTKDGLVETPAFVAVATNAALKAVDLRDVPGVDMIFANTFHLLLHPGVDVVSKAGGLKPFMNAGDGRIIMTDSGGFQVFSLKHGTVHGELTQTQTQTQTHTASLKMKSVKAKRPDRYGSSDVRVGEEGVTFRSYRDGVRVLLTPEGSVSAQKALNGSIIMPLDELPPYHVTDQALRESLDRTHRWMKRSLDRHLLEPRHQLMYGIVHGGSDKALRKASVDAIRAMPFDGYAIGGALGRDRSELYEIVGWVMDECGMWAASRAEDKPVHLLGIADPWSVRRLVQLGVDTFDSCYLTKISRHGTVLTGAPADPGRINIASGRWKGTVGGTMGEVTGCECSTCTQYSVGYLHHLKKAHEVVVDRLLSVHNLEFMARTMRWIRREIRRGTL